MANENSSSSTDANRDPITNAPGSHPVGTGVGAAGAGAAATAVGAAVGGPVGALVGAAVGAVAGGLVGKGIAEKIDPTAEDAYWREHHAEQPFAQSGSAYDEYAPGYRTGYTGYAKHGGGTKSFDDAEPNLRGEYAHQSREAGMINWEDARHAARAAWHRVDQIHGSGSGMGAGPTAG